MTGDVHIPNSPYEPLRDPLNVELDQLRQRVALDSETILKLKAEVKKLEEAWKIEHNAAGKFEGELHVATGTVLFLTKLLAKAIKDEKAI